MSELPVPSSDALLHSEKLVQQIVLRIACENNWISFADYMQMALYAPYLGYYTAGARKLGAAGDFVTAPMISPLFSRCLANFCLQHLPGADILELGAGTGVMAKDILLFLQEHHSLPQHYFILEVSADLRERQQVYLQELIPELYARIIWLDVLPESFSGFILANEVLDAMPVHLFHYRAQQLFEVGVSAQENRFVYQEKIASVDFAHAVSQLPILDEVKDNYLSEINLQLPAFIHSLNGMLRSGFMVFIDYGFDDKTYYHPQRNQGTLMCHYRHYAHTDPFFYPGLQDITAHVDFTALANAALAVGLEVYEYTNQARFLLENGLIEFAKTPDFAMSQQINTLTAVHEMGELFKVMVLEKKAMI